LRNISSSGLLTLTLLFAYPAAPALAQQATAQEQVPPQTGPDEEPTVTEGEILVIAETLRGTVDAPQPPLLELGTEEIAAYGASSIADLLAALGPQTTSGRGRGGGFPVILVNGTRISSFRELRSYPPEAIEKVEVFPEEVAQRYGYSADQRVVNFILKRNYQSREIEAEFGQPWDGGYSAKEVEGTYVRIAGDSRLNLNLGWDDTNLLTEAERGVVQTAGTAAQLPGDPNPAEYRSLVSDSADVEATANWTTRLADNGTSLSLNATFERSDSLRLQGLNNVVLTDPAGTSLLRTFGADDPLSVETRSNTYAIGSALNAPLGDWQLTATADASRIDSRSRIDRRADTTALVAAAEAGQLALDADLGDVADAGYDQADTSTDSATGKVTAAGRPIFLPAGEVSVTFDAGYDWTRITSEDTRNAGERTRLTRGDVNAGVNLSVPITSVRDDVLSAIGDLTLNASGGIDYLSDFGTLTDWTVGLTWGPTETLSVTASYIARETAPSLGELGNPEIATPNVPVYDLTTGETVLATIVTGGNPTLPAQSQGDWKIGLNWQLPFLERSNISVEYYKNHSDDVTASFPLLTPTTEAAFPGRVIRDANGRLVSIDQRPVTFAEQDSERIQVGLNLSGPFGAAQPEAAQGGAAGGRGPFGAAFRGGQGDATVAGGPPAGAGGPGANFDPERFRAIRERMCVRDGAGNLTPMEMTPEAFAELPEPMQQRLRGEDGQFDPARLTALRERMCNMQAPGSGPPGEPGQGQGQAQPGGQAGPPQGGGARGGAPGGGRGPGGPGGFGPGGGGGGDGRGRWMLNLNYTYELNNEVLVSPGGPLLDLLDGDALSGGGQPRHAATLQGGLFYRGFGTRISGTYTGSSRVDGSGLPGSSDLAFNDFVTFDVRVFADLNQQASLIESVPLLENTRISFAMDNIFDARQRVTDNTGTVPLRYQPFLVDPVGRFFEIELRKLF
jgi:hypothetical protein